MAHLKYGTVEYYADMFGDFLADVDGEEVATVDNILAGFYLALDDWFDYHKKQADAYGELRVRVREALAV